MGHFERKFQTRGGIASPTNHCWCKKTTVIVLSCCIKISAMHCLVLSQSMHVTDRQTDGQTEIRQPIPRWHSCSRSKKLKMSGDDEGKIVTRNEKFQVLESEKTTGVIEVSLPSTHSLGLPKEYLSRRRRQEWKLTGQQATRSGI